MNRLHISSYKSHTYSGKKSNRKRVIAQLKRYHGDIKVSRETLWRKKTQSNTPNSSSPKGRVTKTVKSKSSQEIHKEADSQNMTLHSIIKVEDEIVNYPITEIVNYPIMEIVNYPITEIVNYPITDPTHASHQLNIEHSLLTSDIASRPNPVQSTGPALLDAVNRATELLIQALPALPPGSDIAAQVRTGITDLLVLSSAPRCMIETPPQGPTSG